MQINCITGVIVDNGGTYDQSMWLAGKLLQTCFCNYDLMRIKYFKVQMTASHFLFKLLYCILQDYVESSIACDVCTFIQYRQHKIM